VEQGDERRVSALLVGEAHVVGTPAPRVNGLSSSMHLIARSRKMSSVALRVVVPARSR
jgi:hypothetical protein